MVCVVGRLTLWIMVAVTDDKWDLPMPNVLPTPAFVRSFAVVIDYVFAFTFAATMMLLLWLW